MPVVLIGTIEDVNTYNGKNGFGANITMSALIDKRRKSITFNCSNRDVVKKFEDYLQMQVTVRIELNDSKFGMRFGEVIELTPNGKQ